MILLNLENSLVAYECSNSWKICIFRSAALLNKAREIEDKLLPRILLAGFEIEEGKFADADKFIARIFHQRQDYFCLV